ncbi:MAG: hypothetical protein ACPG80_00430, partial [Rickettsiales bacterium]
AAVQLIKELREHHPNAKLMLNRGLPVLDRVAPYLDYALAESIRVEYNFDTGKARYFSDAIYAEETARLKQAQAINPALKVVTLDYWNMADAKGVRNIYAEQRSHGFIPYVTTVKLDTLHEEP